MTESQSTPPVTGGTFTITIGNLTSKPIPWDSPPAIVHAIVDDLMVRATSVPQERFPRGDSDGSEEIT